MTRKLKKMVLGVVLLSLLGVGALVGSAVSAPIFGGPGWAPVAHADGCDTFPPQPGLDCPPVPTATPHK